ncbi:MAG: response regulator [Bacteroidales bacterium]|nr:response regulator [Bacteroidales bacterium]
MFENLFNYDKSKAYKIFLVDDDYFSLTFYKHHVKKIGCSYVKTFSNGQECINTIEEEQPDIIFCDYEMEEMNGLEFIKIVKDKYPNIIIAILSGHDNIYIAADSIKSGAVEYIMKGNKDIEKIRKVLTAYTTAC